jgi:hypothetical protein
MTMNAFNMRMGTPRRGGLLLASAAMALGAGCAVPVYSEPVAVTPAPVASDAIVYVDAVPSNIEIYPHYYYSGGYVYYLNGRWYRQGPRGWGYYRQDPPDLARQQHYDHAPQQGYVGSRERNYVEVAPPAPREAPYAAPRPGVVEAQPRSREVQRARPRNDHEDRSP